MECATGDMNAVFFLRPATVYHMAGEDNLRIGDSERDEAIELLREHMSAGRITAEEFDERMSMALNARTQGDIALLFSDLPGRVPGDLGYNAAPSPLPQTAADGNTPAKRQQWNTPLVIIVTLLVLGILSHHWLFWMFLIGAGWFFMSKSGKDRKAGHRIPHQQPVPLQHQGRHEVITLIRRNQKIAAIKRYRELTGASLITAKEAVDSMAGELGL